MMTWMNKNRRKPARAAKPAMAPVKAPNPPAIEDDELPPPFFADNDPAFLDLGEDSPTVVAKPVATPVIENPPVAVGPCESVETRLAKLVLDLPEFPRRDGRDRTRELLAIYRQLDRIAADAISGEV
ncbi:MAG: hypothetical protein K1X57_00135 [Gemmataceae bacterium]|nr:hypothetical protein [Gemmataceae bacterium]